MTLAHIYQEFGGVKATFRPLDDHDLETEKLQSFEEGYQAGWKDSCSSGMESQVTLSAGVAKNLQEISFGYHEARSKMHQAIAPLLEAIFSIFLPQLLQEMLGPTVLENLTEMMRERLDKPIEISVSQANFEGLSSFLDAQLSLPFMVLKEADLSGDEVYLRLGDQEREINFDDLIAEVRTRTLSLFEMEHANG